MLKTAVDVNAIETAGPGYGEGVEGLPADAATMRPVALPCMSVHGFVPLANTRGFFLRKWSHVQGEVRLYIYFRATTDERQTAVPSFVDFVYLTSGVYRVARICDVRVTQQAPCCYFTPIYCCRLQK